MANFEISFEECYPSGNKKHEAKILTDDLCGRKVGDIEYIKGLTFESSGDYRITKIVNNVAAKHKRQKKEQEIEEDQAQAQEKERLDKFKAEFDDDLEFAVEAFTKGLSIEKAKTEYWRRWDDRVQKAAVANVTENPSSEDQGDFMAEAQELVDQGKAKNLTDAMRKLRHQRPGLFAAYLEQSQVQSKAGYGVTL